MFNENKKKNSIFFNSLKNVQKDLTVPLIHTERACEVTTAHVSVAYYQHKSKTMHAATSFTYSVKYCRTWHRSYLYADCVL